MAREFFKNLPNTTTPLTAPRMNALLDGDESMGNIVVDSIRSKNMFDESQLLKASGWTKNSSGYYNGSLTNFYLAFRNGFYVSEQFKANTQYTFSANAYVEGGQALFAFIYTDNTEEYLSITNTSASNISFTTQANKTLSKIAGTYGYGDTEKLFVKNIQLEEGTIATDYAPYQNLDIPTNSLFANINNSVDAANNDLNNATISGQYNYNDSTLHSPYQQNNTYDKWGTVVVITNAMPAVQYRYVYQIALGTSNNIYVRSNINSTGWTLWQKVTLS